MTAAPPRVLVVDDEAPLAEMVATVLRFHGFDVSTAGTAAAALEAARERQPALVVLDVMLPDGDGFEVCRRLREALPGVGIVFLTARDASSDTVTGLSYGGDDYVTKPFAVDVLVARVRAVLRRLHRDGDEPQPPANVLRCADLELDTDACQVSRAGTLVDLSPTEYRLLEYLLRNPGRVLSRAQVLDHVWGYDFGGASTVVDTYVGYLRRKLDPLGPPLIHTQRGFGYVLRAPKDGA